MRERRLAAGWTQRELAVAAAVGVGTVRDLEQGVSKRPREAALNRIAEALGLPPSELRAPSAQDSPPGGGGRPAAGIRFQMFGPLRAWRDGAEVPIAGARSKAILGLLLLQPGAVVSLEAIADVFWDERSRPGSTTVIQTYVSRLRAAFGRVGAGRGRCPLIETVGPGYRLLADEIEVDLAESLGREARARSELLKGDVAGACELFDRAVDPWQRPLLADVGLLRGHPALVRMERDWAQAVVEYAEAASARGWHDRALPHLRTLTSRDPLNERAHACLMIALAGGGHQAEAVEVYEALRRRLDDQLGVLPGPALVQAHMRVLRQDVVPAARTAGRKGMEAGPGPESSGEAWPEPLVRMAAPDGGPFQLPAAVADFTGRSCEIADLAAWVAPDEGCVGVPVVVISGPPGVGKTALMLQAGQMLRESFPGGQLWVRLGAGSGQPRDPAEVLGEWLRALGADGSAIPDSLEERAAVYRSILAGRRVLVAMDDAASAAQVRPLLPGTAGSAALVTSRRQLADLPGARLLPVGPFEEGDATGLLARIAGAERIQADPRAASDLIKMCGGLPLAVRVAGARLAARPRLPVAALAESLAQESRRLDILRTGDLSVRASLRSGYQALSEQARHAFRLLGALGPGDFADWVLATLLGEPTADAVMDELIDRCLLTTVEGDMGGRLRFRLHDLLRGFAVEELARRPESEGMAAMARVRQAWLQLAVLADAGLPPEPFFPRGDPVEAPRAVPEQEAARLIGDPLVWFASERLNLLTVAGNACAAGDHRFAAELARTLGAFHHLQERHDDAARIWRAVAAAAAREGDVHAEAAALLRLAGAMVERGYAAQALHVLDKCVGAFEILDDARSLASALYWRSSALSDLDEFSRARRDCERGVRLSRQIGDLHAEFMNLRVAGVVLAHVGDYEEALAACEKAAAIAGELGDGVSAHHALHNLAHTCNLAGDHRRAMEVALRRRELCHAAGNLRGVAMSSAVLGDACYGLGRYEEAVAAYTAALPVFQDHFIGRHGAVCSYKLALAYQALGQPERAEGLLRRSLSAFEDLGLAAYQGRVRQALGLSQVRVGEERPDRPGAFLEAARGAHGLDLADLPAGDAGLPDAVVFDVFPDPLVGFMAGQ